MPREVGQLTEAIERLPPTQQAHARKLMAELAERDQDGLNLYRPMPKQEEFHRSLAQTRIATGGNRGGKSIATYAEVARAVQGKDPYGKYPKPNADGIFDGGFTVWIVCHKQEMIGRTAYRLLFKPGAFDVIRDLTTGQYRPYNQNDPSDKQRAAEKRPAPPLIPKRLYDEKDIAWANGEKKAKVFSRVRLKNGAVIFAFSSKAMPSTGDPIDLGLIEEDTENPEWLTELQSRCTDRDDARLIWSARPQMKNDALIRLHQQAEQCRGQAEPDVEEFVLDALENPYTSEKQKGHRVRGWTEDEQRTRLHGLFDMDSVLYYPTFHRDVHQHPSTLIDYGALADWLKTSQIPDDACRFMSVDPGPYRVWAALFAAVPPPVVGDFIVIYDEIYLQRGNIPGFVQLVSEKTDGYPFRSFIIDLHGSGIHTGLSELTNLQEIVRAMGRRSIRCETTGSGFSMGDTDVRHRSELVRQSLALRDNRTPAVVILKGRAPNLVNEMVRYKRHNVNGYLTDQPAPRQDNHAINCYDAATEVLTYAGWKLFKDVAEDDLLATVNLNRDTIEYQAPLGVVSRKHQGDMISFGGLKNDALVTPEHRMVVYPKKGYRGYADGKPVIKAACDVTVWDCLKTRATWKGIGDNDPVVLPACFNGKKEFEVPVDRKALAEFLGWFVSEGYVDKTPRCPGSGYRVLISQKKQDTREHLRHLLGRLPWNFVATPDGFQASSKQLWEYVRPIGGTYEKYVPQWIKDASPDVIRSFLAGAVLGDGCFSNGQMSYHTVSKRLADDMQELFLKCGFATSLLSTDPQPYCIHGRTGTNTVVQYHVYRHRAKQAALRDSMNKPNFKPVPYDGQVYCATVPNGTLIVRRNGKVLVCGNCLEYLVAHHPKYARPRKTGRVSPAYQMYLDAKEKRRESDVIYLGAGAPTDEPAFSFN